MLRASGTEPRAGPTRSKLFTWGIWATLLIQNRITGPEGLEDERGAPLKSGQNWHRGVEKRPVAKIATAARHDHSPGRLRHGENADQPAALLELPVKAVRGLLGRAVEDNHVIGRVRRIPIGNVRSPDRHPFKPKLDQKLPGLRGQRRVDFGRRHLSRKLGNQGGGISGGAAGHQNAVGILDISGLQNLRYDCRLDQKAPYRAAFADLDIEVETGQRALTLRDKNLPRHREH